MDNTKTIDIASLPMAESVSSKDTLLVMRQGESGKNELMRVEKGTLTAAPAKKRVKRYVIGRAISLGSVNDTGHENWYCYGYGYGSGYGSMLVPIRADVSELKHLFVDGVEFSKSTIAVDLTWKTTERTSGGTTLVLRYCSSKQAYGRAFNVIGYEGGAGKPTSLHLRSELLPHLATVRSDSTHHSIEQGKHVWKSNVHMGVVVLNDDTFLKPGQTSQDIFIPSGKGGNKTMHVKARFYSRRVRTKVSFLRNCKLAGESIDSSGHSVYKKKFTARHASGDADFPVRTSWRSQKVVIRLQAVSKYRKGEILNIVLNTRTDDENNVFFKWK